MSDNFRFSARINNAHQIRWRPWGARAFAEAVAANKPVLLNLTAVWCHWCHLMDETTYSDSSLIALINESFLPIRVDADKHPHVQDRYIAGGWPTNAFLTPTGEVLWSGTYVPPEEFRSVAESVTSAWRQRHVELQLEIERRRKAMEAARGRHHLAGLVRREAADDVLSATIDGYDARNGGFGADPKFPYNDAIELLYAHGQRGNADLLRMADHSLDGMLAGELLDQDGGFFRYALKEDWSDPRREKLLTANASLLRIFALGAQIRARPDWRAIAANIVRWADQHLRRDDGLWAASQQLDGPADDILYTSYNAFWISSLADAGARLGEARWVDTAAAGLERLVTAMRIQGGLFRHYDSGPSTEDPAVLLVDVVEVCRACLQVAQSTGRNEFLELARELARIAEKQLWAEDGGFWDSAKPREEIAALRYRDKPFDTNADFARILNDLSLLTGDRSFRALAERILALLSPQAGRYGPAAATFALTVEEFFEAPARIVIAGNGAGADALRSAALQLPVAERRVLTLPHGGRIAQFNFPAGDSPAAFVVNARGASAALGNAELLEKALATKG